MLLQGPEDMARPSSILHPGMMPTQGHYSQDCTGLDLGFKGAVGQPSARSGAGAGARQWSRLPPPLPAPGPGPPGPIWFQSALPAVPEGLPRTP